MPTGSPATCPGRAGEIKPMQEPIAIGCPSIDVHDRRCG
jgi:hypothetical protein